MLDDLAASLTRPREYRRFAAEKRARTASYIAFLAMIFVGALAISVKLRLAPIFAETFSWLEASMPTLRFSAGKVASDARGPLRLEHPRYKDVAIVIDTSRVEPVTPKMMEDAKVSAYLTANALYLPGPQPGRLETLDLSRAGTSGTAVLDAASYREMKKSFDWVFYPSILLLFFVLFSASVAFFGLLYALAGMLMTRAGRAPLGFSALFRVAVHAQSAAALLRALDQLSPVSIPYSGLISLVLSLAYLGLGARAASVPESPLPAA